MEKHWLPLAFIYLYPNPLIFFSLLCFLLPGLHVSLTFNVRYQARMHTQTPGKETRTRAFAFTPVVLALSCQVHKYIFLSLSLSLSSFLSLSQMFASKKITGFNSGPILPSSKPRRWQCPPGLSRVMVSLSSAPFASPK